MQAYRKNHRSGFSLIEIIVVVGIIAILVSMVLAGVGVVRKIAKERRMERSIALIHAAVVLRSDNDVARQIHHTETVNYTVTGSGINRNMTSMEYLIYELMNHPDSRKLLEGAEWLFVEVAPSVTVQIDVTGDGVADNEETGVRLLTVHDVYGNEFEFRNGWASNGVNPAASSYADGYEAALPYDSAFFLASPGKDGVWGELTDGRLDDVNEAAEDNYYSQLEHR